MFDTNHNHSQIFIHLQTKILLLFQSKCNTTLKGSSAIIRCKHSKENKQMFSKNGKFIIIEQLRNVKTTPTETLKLIRLRKRILVLHNLN